jgi:hypothetical protein
MHQEYFLAAEPYSHEYPRKGEALTKSEAIAEGAKFFKEKEIAENGNSCPCGTLGKYSLTYIGTTSNEPVYGLT